MFLRAADFRNTSKGIPLRPRGWRLLAAGACALLSLKGPCEQAEGDSVRVLGCPPVPNGASPWGIAQPPIGDGKNDSAMLSMVREGGGVSVAMGNADARGVAAAVRRFCLGQTNKL